MSVENVTSILLPAAQVDVYASDEGTAGKLRALASDWRFARVHINVERAGIDAAIAHYQSSPAPPLIIIETDDISDAFLQNLGALASFCTSDTEAIIVGPKNDVHLYRSLIEMGVKDYLVRPVSEEDFVKVIARILIDKKGISESHLITVMGSKGGVGATTVSQLLACGISDTLGQKTMLLDAACSAGSLGIAFGVEPATTLSDAVRIADTGSEDDLKRIYQSVNDNLSLLICGGEPILMESPSPDSMEKMVNRIMQKHPVAVMDVSSAGRQVQRRMLERASSIFLVTSTHLPALRNARALIGELKLLKSSLQGVNVVVNMQGLSGADEIPAKDIQIALDVEPAVYIPYLPKVFISSETEGKPAAYNKDAAKFMNGLVHIAERELGITTKQGAAVSGKGSFVESLAKIFGK